jgi:ferredoxin
MATTAIASASHTRGVHRFRLALQIVFLVLFFVLLTLTVWPLGSVALGAFLGADPLIALGSAASGVWLWPGFIAIGMLVLPLVAGRAFCGYACPTGTIIERTTPSKGPGRLPHAWRAKLRTLPAFVLIVCAGLLLFGSSAYLFFDPLATLTRTATTLLYPLLDRVLRLSGDVAYLVAPLRPAVDAATGALSGRFIFTRPLVYGLQLGVLGMFAGMLAVSWLEPRMWCRDLCPLGALLGLVGRFAVIGRTVDADVCISCGKCRAICPMDAIPDDFHATDKSRCQSCYRCADVCPVGAISVGARARASVWTYSPTRRGIVTAGGLAVLAGFFTFTGLGRREKAPQLVRPPGARAEADVLALCSRCGQCMKVCPTNVIQPAVSAGFEGVFTPQMDYRIGYCEWSCNECGKVCPTGTIRPLALEAKHKTAIGRAYIDRNRCIPWADYKTCLVCQELCPVPEKAITINTADVKTPDGTMVTLGRPEVVAARCIGCGVCANACPVANRPAIEVYALAEKA